MYEGVYKDIIIFYDVVHGGVLLADIYIYIYATSIVGGDPGIGVKGFF